MVAGFRWEPPAPPAWARGGGGSTAWARGGGGPPPRHVVVGLGAHDHAVHDLGLGRKFYCELLAGALDHRPVRAGHLAVEGAPADEGRIDHVAVGLHAE